MRLNSSIKEVKGIGDKTAGLFLKINIETIRDLISYFPRTYVQFPEIKRPDEVVEGETAAVIGQIRQTPVVKRVRSMQITVTSIAGMGKRLELVWFRLPYIKNSLHPGENYVFYGKVQHKNGGLSWSSRQFIRRKNMRRWNICCFRFTPCRKDYQISLC
nr:hypothetical protein [Roseburia inulinivorans]